MILVVIFIIFSISNWHIYLEMNGYYTNDGILNENLVNTAFYYLDEVIKQNINDKKFILWIKKIKTNLPIVHIECLNI